MARRTPSVRSAASTATLVHGRHKSVHARRSKFSHRNSPLSEKSADLRGFITFFWMGVAWYTVFTLTRSYRDHGAFVNRRFVEILLHDYQGLASADAVMIFSCGTCVAIVSLVKHGWIGRRVGALLGGLWLTGWFLSWMVWIYRRDWFWSQTGFLTMHCIAMLMKQHSYLASNWEMFWKREVFEVLEAEIRELIDEDLSSLEASPVSSTTPTIRRESISSVELEERKRTESKLAMMRADKESLRSDLEGKWKKTIAFPNTITVLNFIDYMLVPSLVYELEYPRTEKLNISAFLERCAYTLMSFALLGTTVDQWILPVLHQSRNMDFATTVVYLIMPFMVCFMMLFFIIFECICNAFAELTCFADREFYQDWWNACTFDEYARKWNKPVHEFLLRHVYLESISTYRVSKHNAALLTFFVSSVFHELVIFMVGKRGRVWLFLFQMLQIPLIMVARIEVVKRQRTFGNALFWFAMFLGPPLLSVMYAREHYLEM